MKRTIIIKVLFLVLSMSPIASQAGLFSSRTKNTKLSPDKVTYDAIVHENEISAVAFRQYATNVLNNSVKDIFSGKAHMERLTGTVDQLGTRRDLNSALLQARKTKQFCLGRIDVITNFNSAINASYNPKARKIRNDYLVAYRDYVELTEMMISILEQCINIHKLSCAMQKLAANQKLTVDEDKLLEKFMKGKTFTESSNAFGDAFENVGKLMLKYTAKERELKEHLKQWE